jgi:hypothetical protein
MLPHAQRRKRAIRMRIAEMTITCHFTSDRNME